MVGLAGKKQPPSQKLLMQFEEILHRLDNRIPTLQKTEIKTKDSQSLLDVCPEEYMGWRLGYPLYSKGWEIADCKNVRPLETVVTVLINAVHYSNKDLEQLHFVLNGIKQAYPTLKVFLAVPQKYKVDEVKVSKNVNFLRLSVKGHRKAGGIWNILVRKASTPYVLIARDVIHFSWLSQLRRQIRIVSEVPNVGVAGGSHRNSSGRWKMDCYQSTIRNYQLEYQEGFFYSRNECMFCDYLQGPFVARKSILKFDERIDNEVVFEDFFLSLAKSNTFTMGCPDSMYFTTDYSHQKIIDRNVWLSFAKKWILNRVLLPRNVSHSFSCEDIGFQCHNKVTRSFLLPVCCQEQYEKILAVLRNFTESNGIYFELDTGSVLGTVKFNGMLPWDMDGDVSLLASESLKIFKSKSAEEHFKKHGIKLDARKAPDYVQFTLNKLFIEGWRMGNLTSNIFIPKQGLRSRQTFSLVRNTWIPNAFSPGMYARNRYGAEILRHSQSWIVHGKKNSFSDYGDTAGTFTSCEKPDHHSCLHDFPSDGNIDILVH